MQISLMRIVGIMTFVVACVAPDRYSYSTNGHSSAYAASDEYRGDYYDRRTDEYEHHAYQPDYSPSYVKRHYGIGEGLVQQ